MRREGRGRAHTLSLEIKHWATGGVSNLSWKHVYFFSLMKFCCSLGFEAYLLSLNCINYF